MDPTESVSIGSSGNANGRASWNQLFRLIALQSRRISGRSVRAFRQALAPQAHKAGEALARVKPCAVLGEGPSPGTFRQARVCGLAGR